MYACVHARHKYLAICSTDASCTLQSIYFVHTTVGSTDGNFPSLSDLAELCEGGMHSYADIIELS